MKLFYYAHFSPIGYERQGGAAVVAWDTIKLLATIPNISLAVGHVGESESAPPSWLKQSKAEVVLHAIRKPSDLVSVVADFEPDIFQGMLYHCREALRFCKQKKIPTVYDVHSVSCFPVNWKHRLQIPLFKGWRAFLANRRDRDTASLASVVIRPSHFAVNTCIANYGIDPDKVKLVYNSIDVDVFCAQAQNNSGFFKLVNAGRIAFDRHFKMTIKIYVRIKKSWPEATLTLAGEGHQRQEIEEWVNAEGIEGVSFVGVLKREELALFYKNADVLLNTSEIESFGNVVAEAMSSSLPVVCFDVGSLSELVEDGVTGFLNDFGDEKAHVTAVRRLFEDPERAEKMGKNGRAVVEKLFSPDVRRDSLLNLYKNLI